MTDPDQRRETVAQTLYKQWQPRGTGAPPHAFYDAADAVLSVLPECRRLSQAEAARWLCDESWHGRWNPKDHLNMLPLAQHTAAVIYDAGYVLAASFPYTEEPADG